MSQHETQFLLDSNIFIHSKNDYYAFDICPGFWDTLIRNSREDRVISIDRVLAELKEGKDELSVWAGSTNDSFFQSTADPQVLIAYSELMNWSASNSQFTDAAKVEFAEADNADAWLVAYAKVKGCVVVTHEQFIPDVKRRVPIPNACKEFDIPYINTYDMLRSLNAKFIENVASS